MKKRTRKKLLDHQRVRWAAVGVSLLIVALAVLYAFKLYRVAP